MQLHVFDGNDAVGNVLVCRECANEREAEGERALDTTEGAQCEDCGAEGRELPVLRAAAFGPGAPR